MRFTGKTGRPGTEAKRFSLASGERVRLRLDGAVTQEHRRCGGIRPTAPCAMDRRSPLVPHVVSGATQVSHVVSDVVQVADAMSSSTQMMDMVSSATQMIRVAA